MDDELTWDMADLQRIMSGQGQAGDMELTRQEIRKIASKYTTDEREIARLVELAEKALRLGPDGVERVRAYAERVARKSGKDKGEG